MSSYGWDDLEPETRSSIEHGEDEWNVVSNDNPGRRIGVAVIIGRTCYSLQWAKP